MTTVTKAPTFSGFVGATARATVLENCRQQKMNPSKWAEPKTYSEGTLLYNWYEGKFDVSTLSKVTSQPSQYDHYYQTIYKTTYSQSPPKVPECLKYYSGLQYTFYLEILGFFGGGGGLLWICEIWGLQ